MAQTGSAIVNGTCDAGLQVRRERISRSFTRKSTGSWMARISSSNQDQQLKHAIDVGDPLFQSTDIRYKVPSGPGQPTVTVWSDFEGLTYMDALLSTVYVGQADGPYRPNSNGENLQRPTISVALHGTRGTTNNNDSAPIPQCCTVLALPPFPPAPGKGPSSHHNTRGTFYPVSAPRLIDYADRSPSESGHDEVLQSLINPSDRAQLVDALEYTWYDRVTNIADSGNIQAAADRVGRVVDNVPPIHPCITALCAVGIRCLTMHDTIDLGKAICKVIERGIARYCSIGTSEIREPVAKLLYFMQKSTDLANEVFQNHVVGISISHSVPRGGALQLYVNRSARVG